jgi:flagellar protein FlaG
MNIDVVQAAMPAAAIDPVPGAGAAGSVAVAPPPPAGNQDPAAAPDPAAAARAAREASRQFAESGIELSIEFDDQLGHSIYRLVDGQTGQVMRQLPSKEVVAIAHALAEQAKSGVLVRADA